MRIQVFNFFSAVLKHFPEETHSTVYHLDPVDTECIYTRETVKADGSLDYFLHRTEGIIFSELCMALQQSLK